MFCNEDKQKVFLSFKIGTSEQHTDDNTFVIRRVSLFTTTSSGSQVVKNFHLGLLFTNI